MTKLRKGDVVSLRGVVKYDSEASDRPVSVMVDGSYGTATVDREHVTLIHSTFEAGDEVIYSLPNIGRDNERGEVIAQHDDKVWVKRRDGKFSTAEARNVYRIEPPIIDQEALKEEAETPQPAAADASDAEPF